MSRNLKMPWSMKDTVENMECIRDLMIKKVRAVNLDGKAEEDVREVNFDFDRAKKALEKQIPQKPKIVYGEKTVCHNLGRQILFYCPGCGKYIVGIYATDPMRGGGIHPMLNGCSTCLQAIDFDEWKKKEPEDDLAFED